MAYSRSPIHYPLVYSEICEKVGVLREDWNMEAENEKQGLKLRGHFYAFVGAVRREARLEQDRVAAGSKPKPDKQKWIDVDQWASRVMVAVEKDATSGKWHIAFRNRDFSWQAQLLRKAVITRSEPETGRLVEAERPAAGTGIEEEQRALAERLRRDGLLGKEER